MATKTANDAKKGKNILKYGRLITIASRIGGGSGDPCNNAKLKTAIEQAKKVWNMPKRILKGAIKKGTGEWRRNLEEFSYEGFGREELP